MVLPIVKYGTPVLRQKGTRIAELTPEVKELVADMLETMEKASGVGLAAQQVGRALQLCVVDVRAVKDRDRPSSATIDGTEVEVATMMPLVLINPEIKTSGDPASSGEGCLSFPEVYAKIERPSVVEVKATNQKGEKLHFTARGLLSRAIQHEYDHLQGILFIDRMDRKAKEELKPDIEAIQSETKAALKKKHS